MYYCENCETKFEEPSKKNITYEDYYGVGNLFYDRHQMDILVCPFCNSEDIQEMQKCDVCEEYFLEDDLTDTEEAVNGGIGYLCDDCLEDCDVKFI